MKFNVLGVAAAAAIALCSPLAVQAQGNYAQLADNVMQMLTAQGFDTTGFEDLTLSQIALIATLIEDPANKGMIQGMLRGTCGQIVLGK